MNLIGLQRDASQQIKAIEISQKYLFYNVLNSVAKLVFDVVEQILIHDMLCLSTHLDSGCTYTHKKRT